MARGADAEVHTRARQQAAVAELGQRALAGMELEDLHEEAVAATARELGTEFVALLELTSDGSGLLVRSTHGWPEGMADGVVPADEDTLPGYAVRANGPVICEDFRTEKRFGPSGYQREQGVVSAMAAPIGARGSQFGILGVASRTPHQFSRDDANFVQALANVVGAAADRARTDELVRDSEARFRELADTAPALMWMTDADGEVTFVNESWLRFTGKSLDDHVGATFGESAHPDDRLAIHERWTEALRHRQEFRKEYRLRRHDGDYRWVLEIGVPRYTGEEFVGYVGTATDIHERKMMEERLREVYEQEHRVAETLQRSLLPERLPQIEGIELAARYLPAGADSAVGGDWYDAVELQDGRVAVVVGDVVGHGLRAAATMGQLRNACRAYALVEASPAEVVARLNRLVIRGGEEAMATALYLVFDRETGEVTFTSAGHPPPLVVSPDGPRFLEGGRSMPIGAAEGATFNEDTTIIPPGSTLLLYTDGLVERRDVPLEDRLAQLRAAAVAAGGELLNLCDQVLEGVLGAREPDDDVALLAVRPEPASANRLALNLPAEPEVLAPLRRRIHRFLSAVGASEAETYEITLTVSEAAGNCIEHAYGPGDATFEVEVSLDGSDVVAWVRDSGSWRQRPEQAPDVPPARGRGLRIIEGLMDDVEVSTQPAGTVVRMRRRLLPRVAA